MSDNLELTVTRYIDAPPQEVWDAMVNRQEEWWCPRPWRVEIVEQDRRPGGRCAMTMFGPNGERNDVEGIYLAWDEGRRFVTTDAVNGELEPSGPFMIGFWEIAPEGDGTRFTGRARHWTEEAKKRHEEMGFEPGWSICAAQLAELCEAA
jgi:uncharacterized protein YndB with AHSA1/START domain